MADGKVKTAEKDSKKYGYWMAFWRKGSKVRNVHLEGCAKMDQEVSMQKAMEIKAEGSRDILAFHIRPLIATARPSHLASSDTG